MPKEVCNECCEQLDNFHEFYTRTHETQVFFKNLYENVEAVSAADGISDDTLGIIIVKSEETMEIKTLQLSKGKFKLTISCKESKSWLNNNFFIYFTGNSTIQSQSTKVIGKRNVSRNVKSSAKLVKVKKEPVQNDYSQDDEELVDANGRQTSLLKDYPWNCTVCEQTGFSNAKVINILN